MSVPLNQPQTVSKIPPNNLHHKVLSATQTSGGKKIKGGGTTSATAPVVNQSGSQVSALAQNSQSTANATTRTYYIAQNQAANDSKVHNWSSNGATVGSSGGGSRKSKKSRKSRKSRKSNKPKKSRKSRKHKRKNTYKK